MGLSLLGSIFWLLVPDSPSSGLGPNGRWFIRVAGGLLVMSAAAC